MTRLENCVICEEPITNKKPDGSRWHGLITCSTECSNHKRKENLAEASRRYREKLGKPIKPHSDYQGPHGWGW